MTLDMLDASTKEWLHHNRWNSIGCIPFLLHAHSLEHHQFLCWIDVMASNLISPTCGVAFCIMCKLESPTGMHPARELWCDFNKIPLFLAAFREFIQLMRRTKQSAYSESNFSQ